jgi:hypothetical protein
MVANMIFPRLSVLWKTKKVVYKVSTQSTRSDEAFNEVNEDFVAKTCSTLSFSPFLPKLFRFRVDSTTVYRNQKGVTCNIRHVPKLYNGTQDMYIYMFNVQLLHMVHYHVEMYMIRTKLFCTGTLVYGYIFLSQKWVVPEM